MDENEIGTAVIETAISVHRRLGPGLLESVYEAVLQHELQQRGLQAERQVKNPALPGGASQINFSCSGALALSS